MESEWRVDFHLDNIGAAQYIVSGLVRIIEAVHWHSTHIGLRFGLDPVENIVVACLTSMELAHTIANAGTG